MRKGVPTHDEFGFRSQHPGDQFQGSTYGPGGFLEGSMIFQAIRRGGTLFMASFFLPPTGHHDWPFTSIHKSRGGTLGEGSE